MAVSDGIRTFRAATLGAVLVAGVVGCPLAPGSACATDLSVRYEPQQATLRVGEAFRPTVQYLSCRGRKVLETQITYATSDPAILEVNPTSGFARARSVGEATLVAESREFGAPVHIPVTVTAATP